MVDILKVLKKNQKKSNTISPNYQFQFANFSETHLITIVENTRIPSTLIYIPDFISEEDEKVLITNLYDDKLSRAWVSLSSRRVQCYSTISDVNTIIIPPSYLNQLLDQINNSSTIKTIIDHCTSSLNNNPINSLNSHQNIHCPCGHNNDDNNDSNNNNDSNSTSNQEYPVFNHILINEYKYGQGISKCVICIMCVDMYTS